MSWVETIVYSKKWDAKQRVCWIWKHCNIDDSSVHSFHSFVRSFAHSVVRLFIHSIYVFCLFCQFWYLQPFNCLWSRLETLRSQSRASCVQSTHFTVAAWSEVGWLHTACTGLTSQGFEARPKTIKRLKISKLTK